MKTARIINAIFWLYVWLSDALGPVIQEPGSDHYWALKAKQLISFNFALQRYWYGLPPLDHPVASLIGEMLGRGIPPLVLWFVVDRILRRAGRAKPTEES